MGSYKQICSPVPTGQNSRISEDYRTPTTSAPVSDIQPHKVWGLGKTPTKLFTLETHFSCKTNTQTVEKKNVSIFRRFSNIFHRANNSYLIKKKLLASAYELPDVLDENNEDSTIMMDRGQSQNLPISNIRIYPTDWCQVGRLILD